MFFLVSQIVKATIPMALSFKISILVTSVRRLAGSILVIVEIIREIIKVHVVRVVMIGMEGVANLVVVA